LLKVRLDSNKPGISVHHQRQIEYDEQMVSVPKQLEERSSDLVDGRCDHEDQTKRDDDPSDAGSGNKQNHSWCIGTIPLKQNFCIWIAGIAQIIDVENMCSDVNRDKHANGVSTPFVEEDIFIEKSSNGTTALKAATSFVHKVTTHGKQNDCAVESENVGGTSSNG